MYDLQKANLWKRISAVLFDGIMLSVVVVAFALLLSTLFGYDRYVEEKERLEDHYCEKYGINPDLSQEEADAMSEEEKEAYRVALEAANAEISQDPEFSRVLGKLFDLAFLIVSLPILLAFALMEFVVPLLFKNGQTLGKKIFGVAVMRMDGVKLPPVLLFVRTMLGKCILGTMIPVYGCILIFFNASPLLGLVVVVIPLMMQVVLFLAMKNHTPLHDLLAQTVAVDMASQMIFESPEALLEYKKRIHAEETERRER